jgi:hypothetical protein
MPLDSRLVDLIHTRLLVRYAAKWINLYQSVDPADVKADWANELEGIPEYAIRYALENLSPDFPPNAAQFKAICIRRPDPDMPRLPGPRANPQRVAQAIAQAKAALAKRKPLQWAYEMQERESNGERLTEGQRRDWRAALQGGSVQVMNTPGGIVPEESLPPAMRAEREAVYEPH